MAFLNEIGVARLWEHILAKLGNKVDKVDGKDLSTNDYTTTEKNKLAGIAEGANKTTVDSAMSTSSTNPVQNKVVTAAINNLNTLVGDESVAAQISDAIASKSDTNHTHSNYASTVTTTGPGNAITAISQSGHTITATKGSTFLTSETTLSKGTDTTATKTLSHGGTFAAVTDTAVSGHQITDTTTTYTLPSETTLSKGTTSGSGNAVTDISVSGHTVTLTKGSTFSLSGHTHTASDVGADASGSASAALSSAKEYTDAEISEWVGDTTVSEQISEAIADKADVSHTHSAYVNQNAFSNVTVGSTTVAADSATDTLTLVAGDNVTITPDATNDKITIAATDTVYTHPSYTARTGVPTANQTPAFGGTFSVSQPVSDATGHITAVNSRTITIPSTAATTSAAGLMSASDKSKLDGIATGATKVTVDSALSSSSTNPVQNKVVNSAISELNDLVGDTAVSEQISDAFNDAITGLSVSGKTVTYTKGDGSTGTITTQDTDTTYFAGAGIALSGTTFSNSGVRSISTGSTNGTISVNTNGTSADVAVKGLGSAAYTASTAYDAAGAANTALTNAKSYTDSEITEWVGDSTVSSQISSAVSSKQDTITGGATTITSSDLTASRALVSNSSGKVAVSDVTSTELGYLDGVTSNVQTQLNAKAASSHTHSYAGSSSAGGAANVSESDIGITTAGNGSAYTATVMGITALTAGVSFIMIPHVVSASTAPTLNVNSLGAKTLRRRLSSIVTGVQAGYTTTWLAKGVPFRVTYDGTQWIVDGQNKPAAADLYGTLAIDKGGTGATTATDACTNLGAISVALGTAIPSGADLNDYTTHGTYYSVSGANSATLTNTPYTGTGFRMDVFATVSASSHIIQEIKANSASARTYRRIASISDGAWTFGSWYQVVQTTGDVIPIGQGGTGGTTASAALTNLGIVYSTSQPTYVAGKIWLKPIS